MGEVRKLWIEGPAGRIEAALRVARTARAAAVVAHPHPLHGGSLHNPVTFHTDRELNVAGLTTLRFNFRGVGTSEGVHDEGRGELDDVAAAVAWLRGAASGVPLLLVGYSFGAWCALRHAVRDDTVRALVAIGLPLRRYDLTEVRRFDRPLAVVQGTADELGGFEELRQLLAEAGKTAAIYPVEGASHLFPGRAPEAARRVVEAAEVLLREVD